MKTRIYSPILTFVSVGAIWEAFASQNRGAAALPPPQLLLMLLLLATAGVGIFPSSSELRFKIRPQVMKTKQSTHTRALQPLS